jgi:dTDP-4-amino-4,6-dideoxygalactose transaminase
MRSRYVYEGLGFNYRLTDVSASIARVQLRHLDEVIGQRQENAAFLSGAIRSVRTPQVAEGRGHVWHQYTVRLNKGRDRDEAVHRLAEAGIDTGVFYPRGVHQIDHVRAVGGDHHLPETEQAAREVLSLPVHPALSKDDLAAIVEAVNQL